MLVTSTRFKESQESALKEELLKHPNIKIMDDYIENIEEIYQELLSAFAERAGFVPETGCDLAGIHFHHLLIFLDRLLILVLSLEQLHDELALVRQQILEQLSDVDTEMLVDSLACKNRIDVAIECILMQLMDENYFSTSDM